MACSIELCTLCDICYILSTTLALDLVFHEAAERYTVLQVDNNLDIFYQPGSLSCQEREDLVTRFVALICRSVGHSGNQETQTQHIL